MNRVAEVEADPLQVGDELLLYEGVAGGREQLEGFTAMLHQRVAVARRQLARTGVVAHELSNGRFHRVGAGLAGLEDDEQETDGVIGRGFVVSGPIHTRQLDGCPTGFDVRIPLQNLADRLLRIGVVEPFADGAAGGVRGAVDVDDFGEGDVAPDEGRGEGVISHGDVLKCG